MPILNGQKKVEKTLKDLTVFAIMLTFRHFPLGGKPSVDESFFKDYRYVAYGSPVHTVHDPDEARTWKTRDGAVGAMNRLLEQKKIKPETKPRIVRIHYHSTRTYEDVTPEPAAVS